MSFRAPGGRAARIAALALLASGIACGPAVAQRVQPIQPPAQTPEVVAELSVPPPPYPADADLIPFTLYGRTPNKFYVDGKTLTVGADKIIRFVLVVRSPSNVRNVSFAGVNCKTREWKDYAYARTDRTWVVNQQAQWRYIQELSINNYQYTLFDEFFCYGGWRSGAPIGTAELIVRNLKRPITPDSRVPRTYDQQLQN
jgi:hypothetical protein